MAALTSTTYRNQKGYIVSNRNTLTASDTFSYVQSIGQTLELYNTTGVAVPVTIVGSAPNPVNVQGLHGQISVSAGLIITVPASGTVIVNLDTINLYLGGNGTVTLTNGTGVVAHLYN